MITDAGVRAEFEREFHSRTLAYLPGFVDDGRPVVVIISDSAHSPAGHALVHGLINLLARAHRRLIIVGDLDQPLLCPSLFGASTVAEATIGLAQAINPYIEIERTTGLLDGDRLISLGIGPAGADLDLGADRWTAYLEPNATISDNPMSVFGAALAACLGSYAAFSALTGIGGVPSGRWSAWDHVTPGGGQGPDLDGAIDVGRVLCVGAGAVANALAFFGVSCGLGGRWLFVDGDVVDISNLNRQLGFLAVDAGWPNRPAAKKAATLAARVGASATSSPEWYGVSTEVANDAYDVVLALANERGVRPELAYRQPTVLLHATTSRNWQAQVHRHVAGCDDCLTCRLPEGIPLLKCSEGEVHTPADTTADAALPFLSATAGLMLLVALAKLASGRLLDSAHNSVSVDFGGRTIIAQPAIHACRQGCGTRLPADVRRTVDRHSRWRALDATVAGTSIASDPVG